MSLISIPKGETTKITNCFKMSRKNELQRVRLTVIRMAETKFLSSWEEKRAQNHQQSISRGRIIHLNLLSDSLKGEPKVGLKIRN